MPMNVIDIVEMPAKQTKQGCPAKCRAETVMLAYTPAIGDKTLEMLIG